MSDQESEFLDCNSEEEEPSSPSVNSVVDTVSDCNSEEDEPSSPSVNSVIATDDINIFGCGHYKRDCKIQSPCCKKIYTCRFCHDEAEDHTLIRQDIAVVECLHCTKLQPISNQCINGDCNVTFGKYYCGLCKLFDNVDKKQYHCDGCGLCRAGGKDNFFHCEICQMCLPISIKDSHKCITQASQRDCSVCLQDLHTSRIEATIPSCGHLIHGTCYKNLFKNGIYACPTCGVSIIPMKQTWKMIEEEINETPMPEAYANCFCYVDCKDCHKETLTAFHVLGFKCTDCGSFNTARGRGTILTQAQVDEMKNDAESQS